MERDYERFAQNDESNSDDSASAALSAEAFAYRPGTLPGPITDPPGPLTDPPGPIKPEPRTPGEPIGPGPITDPPNLPFGDAYAKLDSKKSGIDPWPEPWPNPDPYPFPNPIPQPPEPQPDPFPPKPEPLPEPEPDPLPWPKPWPKPWTDPLPGPITDPAGPSYPETPGEPWPRLDIPEFPIKGRQT